jgi:hypothetical protein
MRCERPSSRRPSNDFDEIAPPHKRPRCTYSEKASQAGIETDVNLHLDFAFDDVTRKAMVFGTDGSDVDVHMGSSAISFMQKLETGAVQTTVIAFGGDSTHSRHILLSDKDLVPSQYYGRCIKE